MNTKKREAEMTKIFNSGSEDGKAGRLDRLYPYVMFFEFNDTEEFKERGSKKGDELGK